MAHEDPKAFIVLRAGYRGKILKQEIINGCKKNMASYERPRVVELADGLPKSAAGKMPIVPIRGRLPFLGLLHNRLRGV
jgi:acyl-coenzyme A synthetase/AMP-(fatty) acid ligase